MAIRKTKKMLEEEKRLGKPLEVAISETYTKTGGSVALTAKELDIREDTLRRWILHLRLTIKHHMEIEPTDNNN